MSVSVSARWVRAASAVVLAATLAACGGGSGPDTDPGTQPQPQPQPQPPQPPQPSVPSAGDLLSSQKLAAFSTEAMARALALRDERVQGVTPRYGVQTYRLTYRTRDQDGQLLEASGLVAVPLKPAGEASAVVGYQHATIFYDAEAPSNRIEAQEPPIVLASQGYIVVAADYVGFGASKGREHPYLLAEPAAQSVLDMLVAAQAWRLREQVADNGQLYLAGYSEGGYATMATQRALELGANPALLAQLQASFPGGGPYDVQTTLDVQLTRIREQYWWAGLASPGLLSHLGSSVRNELRRALLRVMLPGDADVSYQTTFMDYYLNDDRAAIAAHSNVHEGWSPTRPVYLFHGREDQTVPVEAGLSAYNTLQAASRAQGGAPVHWYECTHSPSRHTECVPEYFLRTLQLMGQTTR